LSLLQTDGNDFRRTDLSGDHQVGGTPAAMRFASMQTDPVAARILPVFSMTGLRGFGMRITSMFIFTSPSIGRTTGLIPKWFSYVGFDTGLGATQPCQRGGAEGVVHRAGRHRLQPSRLLGEVGRY
jgi:hypothetical protein